MDDACLSVVKSELDAYQALYHPGVRKDTRCGYNSKQIKLRV